MDADSLLPITITYEEKGELHSFTIKMGKNVEIYLPATDSYDVYEILAELLQIVVKAVNENCITKATFSSDGL